jgi:hypothetical protein
MMNTSFLGDNIILGCGKIYNHFLSQPSDGLALMDGNRHGLNSVGGTHYFLGQNASCSDSHTPTALSKYSLRNNGFHSKLRKLRINIVSGQQMIYPDSGIRGIVWRMRATLTRSRAGVCGLGFASLRQEDFFPACSEAGLLMP